MSYYKLCHKTDFTPCNAVSIPLQIKVLLCVYILHILNRLTWTSNKSVWKWVVQAEELWSWVLQDLFFVFFKFNIFSLSDPHSVAAYVTRHFLSSRSFSCRSAFCFLFSMPTHTHSLPLCVGSLVETAGRRWVTPQHLGSDCTWIASVFSLSLISNSSHLHSCLFFSHLVLSLQYLLPLSALLSLYFHYLLTVALGLCFLLLCF